MKCPFCGTNNAAGESFCVNCGGYLDASPPQPTGSNQTSPSSATSGMSSGSGAATAVGGTSGTLTPNVRLEGGRYVVEKILGQGGMGAAVMARDTRISDKKVVIKELISDSSDPVQQQEDVRNFQREVKTLATLDHPLIPTVTDSFQEGSRYFMVQEFVDGETLEKRMERVNAPMSEQEALTYTSQVLDILDYLSQQTPPIVHRDIKPANIIIGSRNNRAYLVDFGIARADVAKHTQRKQTSALGTPGYAPPEQYQGNADARSDLYALAATVHHLVTNRDPREYPPFAYPAARSLNPKLSADIEDLLEHALAIKADDRFQSAAEMKREVDAILMDRFHAPGDTSSYLLSGGLSGPMVLPSARTQTGPTRRQGQVTPPPVGAYTGTQRQQQVAPSPVQPPQRQQGNNGVVRNFILLVVVVVLLGAVFIVVPRFTQTGSNVTPTPTSGPEFAPTQTIPVTDDGIGVTTTSNGETIGISDGTYAFDTNRPSGRFKQQSAESLQNSSNNNAAIQTPLRSAIASETNDAEAHIYLENQQVLTSNRTYITLVVATMLTGNSELVSVGRDMLQGAYIAQKQYNIEARKSSDAPLLRLLVANAGGSQSNVSALANQIVKAAQNDKTIVGVMGWPYSGYAQNAYPILNAAKIPSVSPSASSDALTGASPYFFRVNPSDAVQAQVAAKYAQETLKAKNVAIFEDPSDSYSQSLAAGFKTHFSGTVIQETYERGDKQSVISALQDALGKTPAPDLLYFAGYPGDVSAILEELPKNEQFPDLKVFGGDALYSLGGYPQSARAGFNRLRFTSFAYPDEWDVLGAGSRKPAFYTDYGKTYDPANKRPNTYAFSRPAQRVVLAYDATLALTTAAKNIGKPEFTPDEMRQALSQITGDNAIQGASGKISFNEQGDPIDKAVVILYVSPEGYIMMENKLGAGQLTT